MAELDLTDRRILNALQGLARADGEAVRGGRGESGDHEDELLRRTQALRDAGVLRHLSPIFDVFRIGYKSALIAFAVDPARLDEAAAVVSAHPGVSHNYAREHHFNLWAVLAIPRERDFDAEVEDTGARRAGRCRINILPALKLFKIAVEYDMVGEEDGLEAARAEAAGGAPRPDGGGTRDHPRLPGRPAAGHAGRGRTPRASAGRERSGAARQTARDGGRGDPAPDGGGAAAPGSGIQRQRHGLLARPRRAHRGGGRRCWRRTRA